jgi:hypothetical protein
LLTRCPLIVGEMSVDEMSVDKMSVNACRHDVC